VAEPRQAIDRLSALGREYADATHHCWGYRIAAPSGDLERSSDAGEPSGTAGAPILQAIRSAGLANVLVVVIRYFGGTKLGRGGLARAYREAARGAIEGCATLPLVRTTTLRLRGPVASEGEARHRVARHGGTVVGASYEGAETVVLEVSLPVDGAAVLLADLADRTRGGWGPTGGSAAPREGPAR
jgi:putative IMPACT (imprinted ancient) family translation regulator